MTFGIQRADKTGQLNSHFPAFQLTANDEAHSENGWLNPVFRMETFQNFPRIFKQSQGGQSVRTLALFAKHKTPS